jgi:hypothetical protein
MAASRDERRAELMKVLSRENGNRELVDIHDAINRKLRAEGRQPMPGCMVVQEIIDYEFSLDLPRVAAGEGMRWDPSVHGYR